MTTKETSNTLIIFHASCADGFTAAWVAYQYGKSRGLEPDAELYAAHYGNAPPDVTGRDVVIVDFSYPYPEMVAMAEKAKSIICLDHHNSVAQEVKDLDWVIFDNERSGAMLAWDYFAKDIPDAYGLTLCQYVQDRDLWRWELPDSKQISAALTLYKMDVPTWAGFADDLESPDGRSLIVAQGATVLMVQDLMVAQKAKHAVTRTIRGFDVPVVNLAVKLQSELGNLLVNVEDPPPFAACFFLGQDAEGDDTATFSLRSTDRGEDVSAIAKSFTYKGRTGGGHRNAAGFTVPISALYEGLK